MIAAPCFPLTLDDATHQSYMGSIFFVRHADRICAFFLDPQLAAHPFAVFGTIVSAIALGWHQTM